MTIASDRADGILLPLAADRQANPVYRRRQQQRQMIVLALILLDIIVLLFTFALVYHLRFNVFGFLFVPQHSPLRFYSELVFWLIPPWVLVLACYRLYDLRVLHGGVAEYRRLASGCTFAIIMLLACSFFMDEQLIISRAWLIMVWVFSILLLSLARFAARRFLYFLRNRYKGIAQTRVLLVGANAEMREVARQLMSGRNRPGLEVVGFVGERRFNRRPAGPDSAWYQHNRTGQEDWPAAWLGLIEDVRRMVEQQQVDEVIIASTALSHAELFEVVRALTTSKVEIRLAPNLYEILTTGIEVQEINGLPLVTISKVRITGLNSILKRATDMMVSAGVLALLAPVLALIALLVRFDSPGPVLHRRRVVGQGGRVFDAFKFRTMRIDGDKILAENPELQQEWLLTGKLKNDPRITGLGRFLRRSSLDELPQLFNILVGQMSLVGPRMITYQEMVKFGRWQSNLMTVKPGLTGLWQISGRSNLTYDDRVRLDMHYIRNYSLWNDLRILLQTIPAVLFGRGAY